MTNADGGNFILALLAPGDNMEYKYSKNITTGESANDVKNAIKDIYKKSSFKLEPEVTKACRDQSDIEVDCDDSTASIKDHIYTIVIPKAIDGASASNIILAPIDTDSTLSVILPGEFSPPKLSMPPLTGKYFIECYEADGIPRATSSLNYNENASKVKQKIE